LSSSLRALAARDGLVAMRFFGATSPVAMKALFPAGGGTKVVEGLVA
jgi:hypothetical protein